MSVMNKRYKQLVPQPRSKFIQVRCPECANVQTVFSHASTTVKCLVCSRVLALPTGGKAEIDAKVLKVI